VDEHLADQLVAAGVAPQSVAGVERIAAEQGVARPFEVDSFGRS
jgi:hypothetical protein